MEQNSRPNNEKKKRNLQRRTKPQQGVSSSDGKTDGNKIVDEAKQNTNQRAQAPLSIDILVIEFFWL